MSTNEIGGHHPHGPIAGKQGGAAGRSRPFSEIAFVPDVNRRYENRQVDNVRRQLVDDKDVKRFLFLTRRRFEILNAGARALQHEVTLPKAEMGALEANHKEAFRLQRRIHKRYAANFR